MHRNQRVLLSLMMKNNYLHLHSHLQICVYNPTQLSILHNIWTSPLHHRGHHYTIFSLLLCQLLQFLLYSHYRSCEQCLLPFAAASPNLFPVDSFTWAVSFPKDETSGLLSCDQTSASMAGALLSFQHAHAHCVPLGSAPLDVPESSGS